MLDFQEIILRLHRFWERQGCVIWQPHNVHVGAGTSNPATVLRVLGPEPWRVAYQEPCARPDDGRYGENPNRWYEYYQYQVILKPAPANNIDLYLESLEAIGVDRTKHDIRFVEDNWESPSLGAWGLGWEVWLDGLEISQYTYFQQVSGINTDPVCVEITYGLERLALYLQNVYSISDIRWMGNLTYSDLHLPDEIDYCKYNFDYSDTAALQQMYRLYEQEARNALKHDLVLPAHDYLLRCSHTFNILDARGAIGVTQRANYFGRMHDLSNQIARTYLRQREQLGYPWLNRNLFQTVDEQEQPKVARSQTSAPVTQPDDLLFEIGLEELPPDNVQSAIEQLETLIAKLFADERLPYEAVFIGGTPRRLVVQIKQLSPFQSANQRVLKGPATAIAYDAEGNPTKALEGFSRSANIPVSALETQEFQGKQHVVAVITEEGRPASAVLADLLPRVIAELKFIRTMRWNETQVAFPRPIRWIVALLGGMVIDFQYAGIRTGNMTRGIRSMGAPFLQIDSAADYDCVLATQGIIIDVVRRRAMIQEESARQAATLGGSIEDNPDLLDEVTNLVEQPVAAIGSFKQEFLALPTEVLTTVMKKHQRYFPIVRDGNLMASFVVIANGQPSDLPLVIHGNEEVLRARFSDARFFYEVDTRKKLREFIPQLNGLMFQEKLGSYFDKTERLKALTGLLCKQLNLSAEDLESAIRVAELAKADLVTGMVREFTELQGTIGKYYAQVSGENERIAMGIEEHYLPRSANDSLPQDILGIVVGLADRIDTITGLFAVGLKPSAASDPYGLRRAAFGILQILIARDISLPLAPVVCTAADLLPVTVQEGVVEQVLEFIQRRLQGLFLEQGYRHDVVESVLQENASDPAMSAKRIQDLSNWMKRGEFEKILASYARAARLVRKYPKQYSVEGQLLVEKAELQLYEALQKITVTGMPESVHTLMEMLGELAQPINQFFDGVLVMHENEALRNSRLGLLQQIVLLPKGIADLSKLEGF